MTPEHRASGGPGPDLGSESLLTIEQALELAPLKRGAPEVVAGRESLSAPVRWVHIAEARDVASVLRGGELLLTEGRMFEGPEADQRRFVAELAESRIAGVILELDRVHRSVPPLLTKEFERHGIPLIALHVPVPFIEVTEAIHTSVVNTQTALLIEGEAVRRDIMERALAGAPAAELISTLANSLGNPIIFERDGGGIAHQALHHSTERDVLAAWEMLARELAGAPRAVDRRLPAVHGEEMGRLVVLQLSSPLGPAEEAAIDRAAGIISFVLWQARQEEALAARSNRGFLTALVQGEIAPMTAHIRAATSGFTAPVLLPVAIARARHRGGPPVAVEHRVWNQVWREAIEELKQRRAPAMIDPSPHRMTTLAVLGLIDVTRRADTAARFAKLLTSIASRRFDEEHPVVICVGSAVHTWPAVVDGLTVAIDALGAAAFVRPRDWFDAEDLDLDRLLWSLRDNPDLTRFAALRLDRLVIYDRARNTQLVHTLESFLENNGHKAETARSLHLERQSLYNRIDRISELLDVDLSDADARLSLHLALRVRANMRDLGTR